MVVRRYQAKDMRDALRQVREQQGPEAVILSSRRINGMLEVVAAIENTAPIAENSTAGNASTWSNSNSGVDPDLAAMRRELADLRNLLLEQQNLTEQDQWALRHPLAAECIARLQQHGFHEKLARSLAGGIQEETLPETAWARLRARLSASLATVNPTILEQGGLLALVGPTGVGKTTTLFRLALRQIRRMGVDSVIIASLDRQRIGAHKQLQAFAQMAAIPFLPLEHERELINLSERLRDGKLVLIDTEGITARDVTERKPFIQIRQQLNLTTWLVISANYQSSVLKQVLQSFQITDPTGLILTKIDETEQLGETLSILLEQHLGLVFYSDGQRIDNDFQKIDTQYLVRLALHESTRSTKEYKDHSETIMHPDSSIINQINSNNLNNNLNNSIDPPAYSAAATSTGSDALVLESVLPFRKRAHAAH